MRNYEKFTTKICAHSHHKVMEYPTGKAKQRWTRSCYININSLSFFCLYDIRVIWATNVATRTCNYARNINARHTVRLFTLCAFPWATWKIQLVISMLTRKRLKTIQTQSPTINKSSVRRQGKTHRETLFLQLMIMNKSVLPYKQEEIH